MGFDWRNIERVVEAANEIERVRVGIGDYGMLTAVAEAARGLDTVSRAWEEGVRVAAEGPLLGTVSSLLEQRRWEIDAALTLIGECVRQDAFESIVPPLSEAFRQAVAPGLWSPSVGGLADVLTGAEVYGGLASAARVSEVFNVSFGLNKIIEDSLRVAAGLQSLEKVFSAVWEVVPTLPLEEPYGALGFEAHEVWMEFRAGRYGAADDFMKRCLKLRPARDLEERYDRRQALWVILRSAFEGRFGKVAGWMEIEDEEEATAYLRTAIFNEVGRIRQRRRNLDLLWWKEEEMPDDFLPEEKKVRKSPVREVDLPTGLPEGRAEALARSVRAENPLKVVLRLESYELDDRFRALVLLYHHGTLQDRDMVSLVLKGNEPVDLAQVYGWAKVQAFQRKAQRWKAKKVGKLPLGSG